MTTGPERAYLVTGAAGMLGSALGRLFAEESVRCVALTRADLDITRKDAVEAAIGAFAEECSRDGLAGIVINAAAYTDVERAEEEPEAAYRVNETGAAHVAAAAAAAGLGLVHVSTDFVFDGRKAGPYAEDDSPNPLSVYGASKLAGERAVAAAYTEERAVAAAHPGALVVRTAWVYGSPKGGFPGKILEAAKTRDTLEVVADEIGSPTYAPDLAAGLVALARLVAPAGLVTPAEQSAAGLFHLAGTGVCSRYELACEALKAAGLGHVTVEPVDSAEFPTAAERPKNSVLDCSKAAALGVALPHWREALGRLVEVRGAG